MVSVQPVVNKAYTSKGNEYTESNAGKYGAAATVGGGATIIAMKNIHFGSFKKPIENLKKIDLSKVKEIKNVKIKKPNFKNMLQNMFAGIEKLAVKAQINLAKPAKVKAAKKIKMPKMSELKKGMENLISGTKTKAGEFASTATKTLKTPLSLKVAKYGGFAAGAIAAGVAVDYVFNKISAHRADKK